MSLHSVIQTPNPGERVELFRFDTSFIGGPVLYFCQSAKETTGVTFAGQYYTPVDVDFTDLETSSEGQLPTPKLKIRNTNGVIQGVVNAYGDLVGCAVQRVRTFRRFLDGETEADPSAFFGPDTFRVERKTSENPIFIEWELSAAIDQEGKLLPGRVVLRDTCLWRYRIWNPVAGDFDYSTAQCPYTGSASYDRTGQMTTSDKDQCGRRLSDCELRFGVGNPLPFGGFPGAARVRP